MNCEAFESNVNDLARGQKMDATVRAQALAHRVECEPCARLLEDESALSFKLRALAADTSKVAVPGLGKDLLIALRSRQRATTSTTEAATWRSRRMITAAMAVAAMILVVVAVTIMRSRLATPAAKDSTNASSPQSPSADDKLVKAPDAVTDHQPSLLPKKNSVFARSNNLRHKTNRVVLSSQSIVSSDSKDVTTEQTAMNVTPNSAPEITSDFMPVGYTPVASLQEGGQLVRVELPRSALVAFGLPMNVNRYDEKVKADVFFGSDGMARAIRFVQ